MGPHPVRVEVVYLITSDRSASPETMAAWVRGHWHIENKLHWLRDVTYQEDKSLVRAATRHVMTSLPSLAVSVLRLDGHANIAAANRHAPATRGGLASYFKLHEYDFAGSWAGAQGPAKS